MENMQCRECSSEWVCCVHGQSLLYSFSAKTCQTFGGSPICLELDFSQAVSQNRNNSYIITFLLVRKKKKRFLLLHNTLPELGTFHTATVAEMHCCRNTSTCLDMDSIYIQYIHTFINNDLSVSGTNPCWVLTVFTNTKCCNSRIT